MHFALSDERIIGQQLSLNHYSGITILEITI